ncbi:hypothetical protein GJ496_011392 [Pomphorhynchus laevis]|nr:hypothetical protein GJ496_011392 [Pomphorhynchus laevis]
MFTNFTSLFQIKIMTSLLGGKSHYFNRNPSRYSRLYGLSNSLGYISPAAFTTETEHCSSSSIGSNDYLQSPHNDLTSEESSVSSYGLFDHRYGLQGNSGSSDFFTTSNRNVSYSDRNDSQLSFDSMTQELNTYRQALSDILKYNPQRMQNLQQMDHQQAVNVALRNAKRKMAWDANCNRNNDVIKSFREQILEMCEAIIKNHISRSNNWSYKVGFTCHSCDFQWEVNHVIHDLIKSISNPDNFLHSCMTQTPPSCMCPSKQLAGDRKLQRQVRETIEGTQFGLK